MGMDNVIFLEVLEWFHSKNELAHRIPEHGSGEFKLGAQAIVRESQAAVFFSGGAACDALGPGRHTLTTANIPILTKLLSLPWAFTSPIRAEVYFVNLKIFNNLKWGTRDPVAFRDRELGLVRLRAHGIVNIQVTQPVLFINTLVGTRDSYSTMDLEEYLSDVIVSRLNDFLGQHLESLVDLPGAYKDIAEGLETELRHDLAGYGLGLKEMYINAITPPEDVQRAIDDKSRLEVLGNDLERLVTMKTAMAMEEAASGNSAAESGMGMGMGLLLPGLLMGRINQAPGTPSAGEEIRSCPECGLPVDRSARFCPHCGHQILVLRQCRMCGKNLGPTAKFCPSCGAPAGTGPTPRKCGECGTINRPESIFCNRCGNRL